MKENWYAFFIATQRDISVEQALKKMGVKTGYATNGRAEETKRMIDLKKRGYSFREISRMYGMPYSTVRWRISKAKEELMA